MSLVRHSARAHSRALRLARCSLIALTLALSGLPACSDSSGPASEELPADVTKTVGSKGGVLKASGVTLDIPEGALNKDIAVSATNVGKTAPEEVRAKQVSDTYEFGPEGTKFNKDVTVTFPNKNMDDKVEVYFTKEGSREFEIIKSEKRGDQVLAKVRHFSQGFLGVPLDDEPDAGDLPGEDAGEDLPDAEPLDAGADLDTGTSMDALVVPPDAGMQPSDAGPVEATAPDAALPTTRIVIHTRDVYGALVNQTWGAFQDGKSGAWQPLPPPAQPGVYQIDVVNSTYAVALVCANVDTSWGTLRYATTANTTLELGTPGSVCTVGTPVVKHSLSGVVSMPSGYWYWRYGHAHQYVSPALSTNGSTTMPPFTLTELVHDEPNDVLFTTAPGTSSWMISKVTVRRDVQPTADMDAGFNFDLVDGGVAPQGNAQVQMLGATGDAGTIDVHYLTRATEIGLWLNTSATSGVGTRTASFATLPESIRRPTDLYFARGTDDSATQWRHASVATYASGALTFSLPSAFAIGFGSASGPYLRPTFDFTPVANASKYVFNLDYAAGNFHHRFDVELEPAWLGSATGQVQLIFPDFSGVTGYSSSWFAPPAGPLDAKAAAHTFSFDGTTTLKSESGQSTTIQIPL